MYLKRIAQLWNSEHKHWLVPTLLFLAILVLGWYAIARQSVSPMVAILAVALLAFFFAALVYRLLQLQEIHKGLENHIQQLNDRLSQVNNQMLGVYKLSALYAQANTEAEMIDGLLKVCINLVGAQGASFVPLDDRSQPLVAQTQGELPFPAMNTWVEYLASPAVRQQCDHCQSHARLSTSCPLLQGPFSNVIGLFCLPLKSGNREWGVLNLYMPNSGHLDQDAEDFLKTLLQDTALALESKRLRQREFEAIQQMRIIQQKSDFSGLVAALLENIQKAFDADLALIDLQTGHTHRRVVVGEIDKHADNTVQQAIETCLRTGEAIQIESTRQDSLQNEAFFTLLAVPLFSRHKVAIGALLVVNQPGSQNQTHQLNLLHAFAAQVELVVENADLVANIEYRTVIQERSRLAREIHDGLAQTLGLLKLQSLQAISYLNKSDLGKLQSTLSMVHETLSEAYQDIRTAIDGLRMNADVQGSLGWIKPMLLEFEEISGIDTHLELADQPDEVPVEIQTQLMRILQEALNNIRKHSKARNVWLHSTISSGDWWLEIRDDGAGFTAEDIPNASRYGLIGMRERAELIGADFQIISQSDQGTQIRLRIPAILVVDWFGRDQQGASS